MKLSLAPYVLIAYLIAFGLLCQCAWAQEHRVLNNSEKFSFAIAGHSYGAGTENNFGLYPKFVATLETKSEQLDSVVLLGDFVRSCSPAAWQAVSNTFSELKLPFYPVMGNHDYDPYCQEKITNKHGNTFYTFSNSKAQFVVLDSQKDPLRISSDQIELLRSVLETPETSNLVFIFFHELLWVYGRTDYEMVKGNSRSRFNFFSRSNFWSDVAPTIEASPSKKVYIIAGDTGWSPQSIPLYFENRNNMTLVATGMGGLQDENFLIASIKDEIVNFEVVPLNQNNSLKQLKYYTKERIKKLGDVFVRRVDFKVQTANYQILGVMIVTLILLASYLLVRRRRIRGK